MDVARLAVIILHHVAETSVQDAGSTMAEWGRVVAGLRAAPARFNANQGNLLVLDERIEHAGGVAAATDARDDAVRKPADLFARLFDRFAADDGLEVADNLRERMWTDDRAEDVVRGFDTGHPVAHRFVDGV